MTLKVYNILHEDEGEWIIEGLIKMINRKIYTSFSSKISIVQTKSQKECGELIVLDKKSYYKIVSTLGGNKYLEESKKIGIKINLTNLKLPENVYMAFIGSIIYQA
jgi:hypothetical protein